MRLLFKNAFQKVKKSLGRFISLLIIVALGVGFFVGIRSSSPNIINSVDAYYDSNNLMDFKIISYFGLTESDVTAIKELNNISLVAPSYSIDVVSNGEAIRIHSILDDMNTVSLIEGKMPEELNECLGDSKYYKVGDKIEINSNKNLENRVYTVVGTINSVLYTFKDYGISNVGNGKLSSFIYVLEDNFNMEYYTEIYIIAKNTKDTLTYSNEYDKYSEILENELLKLKPIRETIRYEEILEEASDEIIKAESDLYQVKQEGETELNNAKKELDENNNTIIKSEEELNKNLETLNNNIISKTLEFDNAKKEIANSWNVININLSAKGISLDEIDSKIVELENIINDLENTLSALESGTAEYNQVLNDINLYRISLQELKTIQNSIKTLKEQETALNEGIKTFNAEIEKSKQKIEDGRKELDENKLKVNEGYQEYNENLDDFNRQITDAEDKISDIKEEVNTMEKPKWYLQDRTDNYGYIDLKEDTLKVSLISGILPIFFMAVVALMSLNTMTRMIEEERGEIGILTSLGYSNTKIILIYIMYVIISSIFGIISGYFIGNSIIPTVIYSVYTSNYNLPPLILHYDMFVFAIIIVVSLALMCVVTSIACLKELNTKPAMLLRPIPPKKGKKIFLEKIDILWNKLSFIWKVTIRNMFRYKKRVSMTLIGIAGCTALLLAGFGIRDSVDKIAQMQYEDIFKYDDLIILDKETNQIDAELSNLLERENVINPTLIYQTSFTFNRGEKDLETYLIVPSNEEEFYEYFTLNDIDSKELVTLKDDSVIITSKMAQLLDAKVGSAIKIRDNNNVLYILKISAIVENYTLHYIYMSKNMYNEVFQKPINYNIVISNNVANESIMAKNLIASGRVSYISFTTDSLNTFNSLVSGLNRIIFLIIGTSSMLALIVLYNLTTINVSERKREIATLKVLGFYDKEVSEYIYRETILLTLIGIGIGYVAGISLHQIIIRAIELDSTVFIKLIDKVSYLYTFLIVFVFIIVVQIITYVILKKIHMVESLKSVE